MATVYGGHEIRMVTAVLVLENWVYYKNYYICLGWESERGPNLIHSVLIWSLPCSKDSKKKSTKGDRVLSTSRITEPKLQETTELSNRTPLNPYATNSGLPYKIRTSGYIWISAKQQIIF